MLKAPIGQPRGVGTGHPVCTAGASSLGAGAGRQTKRSVRTEAGRGGESQQGRLESSRGHLGGRGTCRGQEAERGDSASRRKESEGEDGKSQPTRHQRPGRRGGGSELKASPLSKAAEINWS